MLSELLRTKGVNATILFDYLTECGIICTEDDILEVRNSKDRFTFRMFRFQPDDAILLGLPHFFKEYFVAILSLDDVPVAAASGSVFDIEPFMDDSDFDALMYSELLTFSSSGLYTLVNHIFPTGDMVSDFSDVNFESLHSLYPNPPVSVCIIDDMYISGDGEFLFRHLLEYLIAYSEVSFFSMKPTDVIDMSMLAVDFENLGFSFSIVDNGLFYACYGPNCCIQDFRYIRIYVLLKTGCSRSQLLLMGYWEKEIDTVMKLA